MTLARAGVVLPPNRIQIGKAPSPVCIVIENLSLTFIQAVPLFGATLDGFAGRGGILNDDHLMPFRGWPDQ